MIAALLPIFPIVVNVPILPPLSFMLFIAWRLIHPEIWFPWAGALLGLFDDMWSGQPLGSGMILFTLAQLLINAADQRILWRDYWQDWILSGVCVVVMLSLALLISNFTGGRLHWFYIVPQILIAILIIPLVTRLCAWLDIWRFQ